MAERFVTDRPSRTILWCVIPVVCRKTDGEVNISHENTTTVPTHKTYTLPTTDH